MNVLFLGVVEFCPPGRSEPDNSNHNDSFPCSGFLALMVMSPLALTMWKLFASHLQRRVSREANDFIHNELFPFSGGISALAFYSSKR